MDNEYIPGGTNANSSVQRHKPPNKSQHADDLASSNCSKNMSANWGSEFKGFRGFLRFCAHHGKKPHVYPFLMAAGVTLAMWSSIPVSGKVFSYKMIPYLALERPSI